MIRLPWLALLSVVILGAAPVARPVPAAADETLEAQCRKTELAVPDSCSCTVDRARKAGIGGSALASLFQDDGASKPVDQATYSRFWQIKTQCVVEATNAALRPPSLSAPVSRAPAPAVAAAAPPPPPALAQAPSAGATTLKSPTPKPSPLASARALPDAGAARMVAPPAGGAVSRGNNGVLVSGFPRFADGTIPTVKVYGNSPLFEPITPGEVAGERVATRRDVVNTHWRWADDAPLVRALDFRPDGLLVETDIVGGKTIKRYGFDAQDRLVIYDYNATGQSYYPQSYTISGKGQLVTHFYSCGRCDAEVYFGTKSGPSSDVLSGAAPDADGYFPIVFRPLSTSGFQPVNPRTFLHSVGLDNATGRFEQATYVDPRSTNSASDNVAVVRFTDPGHERIYLVSVAGTLPKFTLLDLPGATAIAMRKDEPASASYTLRVTMPGGTAYYQCTGKPARQGGSCRRVTP